MDIKIESRDSQCLPILEVEGEVDVYTAPKLKSRILDKIDQGFYKLIIDLTKVDFIDSSGLGVLVGGLKRVGPHKGKVILVINKSNIMKIFNITGLDKVFAIYQKTDDAIKEECS
jgi:anti-sigma B factor antagonist